jgi:hypothetical protein
MFMLCERSRDSSVSTVTRLPDGRGGYWCSILGKEIHFSFMALLSNRYLRSVKFYLERRLRMREAIPQFPYTSSWCGAQ